MSQMPLSKKFEEVLEKPGLYVGSCSIVKIKAFMDGYKDAKFEEGNKDELDLYNGFGDWVRNRFRVTTSQGWSDIVQFMSPDEAYAFQLTKELWSEYKSIL